MRRKDGPSSRAGRPWSFGPGLTKGAAVIDSARAFFGPPFCPREAGEVASAQRESKGARGGRGNDLLHSAFSATPRDTLDGRVGPGHDEWGDAMAHHLAADTIVLGFFAVALAAWGLYLLVFAKRYRDYVIRQQQARWSVPIYRGVGALIIVSSALIVWGIGVGGFESETSPTFGPHLWTSDAVVRDAQSAIRIAHALELAQRPEDGAIQGEAAWLDNCQASLKDGVWYVTNKGHRPGTGYFTGAAVIWIGAQDGRYMGQGFVD